MKKFINRTKIDDAILRAVIMAASKGVKVRTSQVAVRVNTSQRISGLAYPYHTVYWQHKGRNKVSRPTRVNGAILLRLGQGRVRTPNDEAYFHPATIVRNFFRIARHEWGHIAEHQSVGLKYGDAVRGDYYASTNESRAVDWEYEADSKYPFETFETETRALEFELAQRYCPADVAANWKVHFEGQNI